jgi:segregation and condensation protein B
MNTLQQDIEAIIFSSDQAVSMDELCQCLEKYYESGISKDRVKEDLNALIERYKADDYSIELAQSGGGYQFLTKKKYHNLLSVFLNQKRNKKLSTAAMETLSIVAYNQPVEKTQIEHIRGVNSEYTLQRLLEKELIKVGGRSESVGRPVLYSLGDKFLDYFGINSTNDLPKLKDFAPQDNAIGTQEIDFNKKDETK